LLDAATVNVNAGLVPPPGAGFVTVTDIGPAVFGSDGTVASSVDPFSVVVSTTPLNVICDDATKPVPNTVKVNGPLPAASIAGERLVITGDGLLADDAIVNVADGLVPPPGGGLITVTSTVPVTFGSDGTVAVSVPLICKVVPSCSPPKLTCDAATKPDPLTIRVNDPLPSGKVDGEMLLITGEGFVVDDDIVKLTAELVPPPGVGLITVTCTVPVTSGSEDTVAVNVPFPCRVAVSN